MSLLFNKQKYGRPKRPIKVIDYFLIYVFFATFSDDSIMNKHVSERLFPAN